MKWQVKKWRALGLFDERIVEADSVMVEDGTLVFGHGKTVSNYYVFLVLNRDEWSEAELIQDGIKEETP